MSSEPTTRVLRMLHAALLVEKYRYAAMPGQRNIEHEAAQDEALAWVEAMLSQRPSPRIIPDPEGVRREA